MTHHFSDSLDRTGDYWSIVPNRDRFAYLAPEDIKEKNAIKILTISNEVKNCQQMLYCRYLEELTLNNPTKEQFNTLAKLTTLKRLRVSFFRAQSIEAIGELSNLEELVFEYVSGFSDLTPLTKLTKLKSLHLENLRKVSDFQGLKGLNSLRYLCIDGTLDWKQPIKDFAFLKGLPNLEVLALGFVITKSVFPAFLPVLYLKKLQKIKIGLGTFDAKEYAFLEEALTSGLCCSFGDLPWSPTYEIMQGRIDFIGKGSGGVKKDSKDVFSKVAAFKQLYEAYRQESKALILNHNR